MNKQLIMVSSITYAIQGRDILRQRGMKAYIERTPGGRDRAGCGYSIYVDSNTDMAEDILRPVRNQDSGSRRGWGPPMIYLDNAATTAIKPASVRRAMQEAMTKYTANPGRGGYAAIDAHGRNGLSLP